MSRTERERQDELDLDGFRAHLEDMGRAPGTADIYADFLRVLYRDYKRPVLGLSDRDASPATRRLRRAALRSWADYTGNAELLLELRKVRLPQPRRVQPKIPLERDAWFDLRRVIDEADVDEPVRAVLGIMASRGLRCGDVLRLLRSEVRTAIRSGRLAYEAKGERRLEYSARPIRRYLEILDGYDRWKRVEDLISPRARPRSRRRAAARRVGRALKTIATDLGMDAADIYSHRFRRTYATHFLAELEGDPQALQKLQKHMQWTNLVTAAGYSDYVRDEELDEVAARLEIA